MKLLATYATHPALLLLFAAAGTALGLGSPTWSAPAWVVVYASTALLNLVCLPLLVVATLSGLRHLMGLPQPAHRLLMIALVGGALMLLVESVCVCVCTAFTHGARVCVVLHWLCGRRTDAVGRGVVPCAGQLHGTLRAEASIERPIKARMHT